MRSFFVHIARLAHSLCNFCEVLLVLRAVLLGIHGGTCFVWCKATTCRMRPPTAQPDFTARIEEAHGPMRELPTLTHAILLLRTCRETHICAYPPFPRNHLRVTSCRKVIPLRTAQVHTRARGEEPGCLGTAPGRVYHICGQPRKVKSGLKRCQRVLQIRHRYVSTAPSSARCKSRIRSDAWACTLVGLPTNALQSSHVIATPYEGKANNARAGRSRHNYRENAWRISRRYSTGTT